MSLYDYFRRAFLPPNRSDQPGFRNPIWDEESEDDDDELYDEFRHVPSSPFGFRIFTGDVMDMHKYFEQQLDEMWKSFHSSLFDSDLLQLPNPSDMESYADSGRRSGAQRYLKPSYEMKRPEGDDKVDTDIDDRISPADLKKLFPSDNEDERVSSSTRVPTRVFGQSVITRIVRTADGRLEEEKRVRGSDGREEVSITRQIGDQKYRVITKKEKDSGLTDTTEELINLDEDKLEEFNRKWEEKKPTPNIPTDPSSSYVQRYPSSDQGPSIIDKLFEKWFK